MLIQRSLESDEQNKEERGLFASQLQHTPARAELPESDSSPDLPVFLPEDQKVPDGLN